MPGSFRWLHRLLEGNVGLIFRHIGIRPNLLLNRTSQDGFCRIVERPYSYLVDGRFAGLSSPWHNSSISQSMGLGVGLRLCVDLAWSMPSGLCGLVARA